MKHALGAVATVVFGVAMAAAAQAQTAPSGTMQPNSRAMSPPPMSQPSMSQPGMNEQQMGEMQGSQRVSRDEIRQAQEQLQSEGLYRGKIDGVVGPKTRRAIAEFQQRNGLRPTARLDQNTLERLQGGQATGVGSSAPMTQPRAPSGTTGMTPPANSGMTGSNGAVNQAPPPPPSR